MCSAVAVFIKHWLPGGQTGKTYYLVSVKLRCRLYLASHFESVSITRVNSHECHDIRFIRPKKTIFKYRWHYYLEHFFATSFQCDIHMTNTSKSKFFFHFSFGADVRHYRNRFLLFFLYDFCFVEFVRVAANMIMDISVFSEFSKKTVIIDFLLWKLHYRIINKNYNSLN